MDLNKTVPIVLQLAGIVLLSAGIYIKFGFEFGYMALGVCLIVWGTVAEATSKPEVNGKAVRRLRDVGGE